MLLFKYARRDALPLMFSEDRKVSLRFSRPSTFNDPYELFLQADGFVSDGDRAYYKYFLQDIGHFPVGCFSRRPDSIVMWAHYAFERTGFCLGFDEDALAQNFPVAVVGDVKYTDDPPKIDGGTVHYAATTMKNRHTQWLLNEAYSAAYFMKRRDWEYEAERRVLVHLDDLETIDDVLIAKLPGSTIRFIIAGDRADQATLEKCELLARVHEVPLFQFVVGKASYEPFFRDLGNSSVSRWNGTEFEELDETCIECGEPASEFNDDGNCIWCAVSEADAEEAAQGSGILLAARYLTGRIEISFGGVDIKGHAASADDDGEST